jgi:NAD(P)H-hydrate epimerase
MLPILTAEQIRQADAYTIQHTPITSFELMQKAALAFTNKLLELIPHHSPIFIFCGNGNNGGDGLVIARLLQLMSFEVHAFVLQEQGSEDFNQAYRQLQKKPQTIAESLPTIPPSAIVIDALFGTGLNRPLSGRVAQLVQYINRTGNMIVAVDVPSGLILDKNMSDKNIIYATHTISFQYPKLAFFLPQNAQYVGNWHLVEIGLLSEFLTTITCHHYWIQKDSLKTFFKKREKFSHKGTYGHALIVAGSYGKMGAAVLASKACLRTGAGLVTAYVPKCGYEILQIALPEAMVITDENYEHITHINLGQLQPKCIGIGPGIGTKKSTAKALKLLFKNYLHLPFVIDADAINLIAQYRSLLDLLPADSILTPHPKEFERLVGVSSDNYEQLEKLSRFAIEMKVFVLLKGAYSCVATPQGELFFNCSGNSGMATAGSGDVLTGIITGLLAQNYSPKEAALLGMYLHGAAGDFAAKNNSPESMIASDIIQHIGKVFLSE